MATIERYDTKSGRRYRVRYRKPDGRQTDKRGFTTKKAAEAFAATVEVDKLTGAYIDPTLGRVTVGDLAPAWLNRKAGDMKPSSYRPVDTAWRVHVEPKWGRISINAIDLDAVEEWVSYMRREIADADGTITKAGSGATVVLRAYGVLAGILDSAVKAKRIPTNPARTPENLPRKTRKRRVYLDHEQVVALAQVARYPVLILVLACCGLRWGEAIALRVRHLDLLRRRIYIAENAVQVDQTIHIGTTKSEEDRWVPIPEFLVLPLAQLCEGKGPDDLLHTYRGTYLKRPSPQSGWFDSAIVKAGLPKLAVHDLRHTAASLAVSAGANVKALQRMLGHRSAAMTLDVYSDLFDDDLEAVGVALNAALAPSVGKMWARTS